MANGRGSVWRRWDLHIHTPGTKKNDCFSGTTIDDKWNRFYDDIANYIGDGSVPEKAVSAIAVTDYLSIDNYLKVIADNRLPSTIGLVLPNIEIRIQPMANDTPVNMHFIFDPNIVSSLETRFFSKLIFKYDNSISFSATRNELIRLGQTIYPDADEMSAYRFGVNFFVPSLTDVIKVFSEDAQLREATLIGVSNNSSDGASGVTDHCSYLENGASQLVGVRQAIYRTADFIFSGNNSDRRYFLGEKTDSAEEVKRKCRSLKPCLHGCDAHDNSHIFEPSMSKYCWIKADLTFNGLRQVLYEPKSRVWIGPIKPETKSDYQVIDTVMIHDDNFSPAPILFNDKLNCIIGGKSTGKSLLLHNIASTIDAEQARNKTEAAPNKTYRVEQMEVFWADGAVDSMSKKSDHKIVYIPQTYLNRLTDSNEEKTEIDAIIEDIVLTDSSAVTARNALEKAIKTIKTDVDKRVYNLTTIYSELIDLQDKVKELGTKSGIEREIEKIKRQKNALSQENDLQEEDLTQYEEATKALYELQVQSRKVKDDYDLLTTLTSIVELVHPELHSSESMLTELSKAEELVKRAADDEWQKQKEKLLSILNEKDNDISALITHNNAIYLKLQGKVKSNEALHQLSTQLTTEEMRLKRYIDLEKQASAARAQIDSQLETLSKMYIEIETEYKKYADVVNANAQDRDLVFSVSYPFRSNAFAERIKSLFDNRTLKAKNEIIELENFDYSSFPSEKLKKFLAACVYSELPLARGYTLESALRTILDDWFIISYNVTMDGDKIEEMSPGKKALVLLRLLINLADSKSPILIDQPEDDLDNRSITEDLIVFIKEKKIDRQIIVVTHNANVVLGGDAEEVIVANRDGINSKNENFRFEYRSGSIEENMPVLDENGSIRDGILNSVGISQHICSILEGGEVAFNLRKSKYRI